MKTSFIAFWQRNLASARLSLEQQLEYRANFLVDAVLQPVFSAAFEVALWGAIMGTVAAGAIANGADPQQGATLGGFGTKMYLGYALWTTFFARAASSWQNDMSMTSEVQTGAINTILMRPTSFYEHFLFQTLAHKFATTTASLWIPVLVSLVWPLPFHGERLPLALLCLIAYLIFSHTLTFLISTMSFYTTRVQALIWGKNITIAVLAGEMFPLDLLPEPFRHIALASPFASAAYIPVAYVTGRIESPQAWQALYVVCMYAVAIGALAAFGWRRAIKNYTGVGA